MAERPSGAPEGNLVVARVERRQSWAFGKVWVCSSCTSTRAASVSSSTAFEAESVSESEAESFTGELRKVAVGIATAVR